jgi:hypothetical protein
VGVPIVLIGQRLIDAIIKVFIVGKEDMASYIIQLSTILARGQCCALLLAFEGYEMEIIQILHRSRRSRPIPRGSYSNQGSSRTVHPIFAMSLNAGGHVHPLADQLVEAFGGP